MIDQSAPAFVRNPCVRRCLTRFLDLLDKVGFDDRSQRLVEPVTPPKYPELFSPKEPEDDEVAWHHLEQLAREGVIQIERTQKRGLSQLRPWEKTRIVFLPEGEAKARDWLNRHNADPEMEQWAEAAHQFASNFQDLTILKPSSFSSLRPYPAFDVVSRLARLPGLLSERKLSLYQASAILFWGDSKALRGKEKILTQLFGRDFFEMEQRPILIEAAYKTGSEGILVVENMDSFVAASDDRIPGVEHLSILYAQGFKGAASRIRDPRVTRFYWSASALPDPHWARQFQDSWFSEGPVSQPMYYFGDLDPSGLRIYANMRQAFPDMRPWEQGYQLLIDRLRSGEGHRQENTGKSQQGDLINTGCAWMDRVVVPVMKETGLCVDQEAAIQID